MRKVYFHQQGRELLERAGMDFVGFGELSGRIGGMLCFASITVANDRGYRTTLTARDLSGPFRVKLWAAGERPEWFGIADHETVARINECKAKSQASA